jgi:hypothetical protein
MEAWLVNSALLYPNPRIAQLCLRMEYESKYLGCGLLGLHPHCPGALVNTCRGVTWRRLGK